MATFKYNKEKLIFEKTYKVLKYKVVSVCLLLFFAGTLISAIQLKTEKEVLKQVIKQKDKRIATIVQPIREETYVEDLVEAIGHNFSQKEIGQIEEFTSIYRDKLEKEKIPMTLVIWIAYKESRFDHTAKNPTSSASGYFGFVDNTWNAMCKLKGTSNKGRYDKDKQVEVLVTYLNYLYNIHKDWKKVMKAYGGDKFHYPFHFLVK